MKKKPEMQKGAKKKTKMKKRTKKFDPFELDGTKYARLVVVSTNTDIGNTAAQDRATAADLEMTNAHPLLDDPVVQRVVEQVWKFEDNLSAQRYRRGGCIADAYQEYEEGWILRREVVVKIIIDYLRAHPELLE